MENSEQKLNEYMTQITSIYAESVNEKILEKKFANYNQITILVTESKKLIDELLNEIKNIDVNISDTTKIANINELVSVLDGKPNFSETMYVVNEFQKIMNSLPQLSTINDNIEKDVIYEEQIVDTFE